MNQEEALKVLGLQTGATAAEITNAAAQKKADIQNKITSAPTDALKAKFQQLLDKIIAAEQMLSQPKQSRSPLSETQNADLPGMAPAGADSSAQTLEPGAVLLNRYEIKQHIAQGGMGAVYRAHDKNRDEDIAIKIMLPQLMQNETARERFLAEARLSSQLSHPNIVNVYDVQQDNELCFLTMELLEGQDLRELMDNRKLARQNFNIEEVVEILSPICAALDHAHEVTIHRDIKPENIFLTEDGKYKLMDFGIARVMSTSQRTQTGAASGTAYYMSPEQLKGAKDIDGRADQYALAVLAYELLSGEVPAGAIEPLHELVKGINKKVSAAVQKALSPRAENRFDTLSEFLAALQGSGKGVAMPVLPVKAMGIAASVIGVVVLLVMLGSSGALSNLSDLLPQSAEELAAQKATSIQLQGEVETLKRRLESRQRDLKQQVRDAERNKDKNLWALEDWQGLVDNHIFESSRYGKLNGLEKLSESQVRDKEYPQAEKTLSQIKTEYESLLSLFSAAEKLSVIKGQTEQQKEKWVGYLMDGYSVQSKGSSADAQYSTAQQQRSQGDLVEAQSSYQQAYSEYKQLNQTVQQKQAQARQAAVNAQAEERRKQQLANDREQRRQAAAREEKRKADEYLASVEKARSDVISLVESNDSQESVGYDVDGYRYTFQYVIRDFDIEECMLSFENVLIDDSNGEENRRESKVALAVITDVKFDSYENYRVVALKAKGGVKVNGASWNGVGMRVDTEYLSRSEKQKFVKDMLLLRDDAMKRGCKTGVRS